MAITVSKLAVYPLKSAKGNFLKEVEITPRGLENDRLWMVIDENTREFISQRPIPGHEPRLALVFNKVFPNGELMLDAKGIGATLVTDPNKDPDAKPIMVNLFGNDVPALDAGREGASFLSAYLRRPVRLVRFPDSEIRQVDQAYGRPQDNTGYADGYPILIASEESHAALNVNSGIDRFRPNIVLRGLEPFEEDSIAALQIGDVVLELQKPCKRCPMPSVNQETGEFEKETNPLPALAKLRKGDDGAGLKGVFFGVNASPTTLGTIKLGDAVTILRRHDQLHPAVAGAALRYGKREPA